MQYCISLTAVIILNVVYSLRLVSLRRNFPVRSMALNAKSFDPAGQIKFMTYNIDGLNPTALQYRTKTILGLIISEDADIVQLQEVVHETAPALINALTAGGYSSFHQSDDFARMCHYFTLTFAKTSKIQGAQVSRIPYYGTAASEQGRDLLLLRLNYANMPWLFANCHLESCGVAFKSPGSTIRQAQLSEGLTLIEQHASRGPAILAGDLNIREPEASKVMQSFAGSIVDASAELEKGRKSNTWYMPGPSAYSARYDRVYSNRACGLAPSSMKIIGGDDIYQNMLPTSVQSEAELPYRTPSDHRGIVVTYAFTAPADGGSSTQSVTSSVSTQLQQQLHQQSTGRDSSRAAWQDHPSRGKGSVSGIDGTTIHSTSSTSSTGTVSRARSGTAAASHSSSSSAGSSCNSSRKRNSTQMSNSVNSDITDLTGESNKSSRTTVSSREVEVIVIDSSDDEMCAVNVSKQPRSAHYTSSSQASTASSSISASAGAGTGTDSQNSDTGDTVVGDDRSRRRELFLQAAERRSATS